MHDIESVRVLSVTDEHLVVTCAFHPEMRHPERRRTSADGGISRGASVVIRARSLHPLEKTRVFGMTHSRSGRRGPSG
jgi:hypothetical protein